MTDSDEVKLLPSNSAEFCCVRKMGDYVLMAVAPKGEETLRYWLSLGGAEVLAAEINGALSTRPPVVTDEVVERLALALGAALKRRCGDRAWADEKRCVAEDTILAEVDGEIDLLDLARAALASMPAVVSGGPGVGTFNLGDLVQKKGRASWRGKVVGSYQTELTELGYAVESSFEPGSVQIYPSTALLPWDGAAQSEIGE